MNLTNSETVNTHFDDVCKNMFIKTPTNKNMKTPFIVTSFSQYLVHIKMELLFYGQRFHERSRYREGLVDTHKFHETLVELLVTPT